MPLFPKLLLPLALSGLALPALAQTAAPAADTTTTYKHALGLTASPMLDHFFTSNRSLPLGLLYTRQTKPGRLLRLRLVGQFSRRDTANYPGSFPGSYFPGYREGTYTQLVRLQAFVGYEWRHPLARRWHWSHGLDIGAGWSRQTEHSIYDSNTGTASRTTLIRIATIWEGQARPFLGLYYLLSPKIKLFAESAVLLTYQSRKDERDISGSGPSIPVYTYDKSASFILLWRPVQLIGTSINF